MNKKHDNQTPKKQAPSMPHSGAEPLLTQTDTDYAYRPVADDLWAPETFLDFYEEPTADEDYPHGTV